MRLPYTSLLKDRKWTVYSTKFYLISRFKSEIMKYLNVAEKNDAAKNIALHLSRGTSRRREGLSQYNKIYEFEAEVLGSKCQMVMTSVSGHLLGLDFVSAYRNWRTCNPLSLFDAPVYKHCPENYDKIKKTLEREVRSCQGLIIWTDCDREGENIGFEIIEVCRAVKSNLRIYRAKFSEITAVSVRRALLNLEQPNKNISDAVDVRQELDLRIGAAFTRFQTLRLQKVFPTKLAESLVSYGSCQFPTLGFVVERYRAVENFVAEPFWKIRVKHTMNNLSVEFTWSRVRLFDEDACRALHDVCTESPRATVTDVKTKPKSKWRPLPLDTVELEKLASRKLKINAKETMRIAEKLYTQGLISYPRTETNEFPREMDLGQLVGMQTADPGWGAFAQGILDSGGPTPRQGNKSDKAHPPIHPTKYTNSLSGNEQRVYEFIVRSFLACCSKDAQGQETVVSIDVAGEAFSASGLMITARNYLDVYPYDKWSSKEIHVYENGQTFDPTSIDMVDGSTSPPNLLTEADLIALMEKHGIGTDATHAEHIETIKSRSYVALADGVHFVPGVLGMGLVEGYDAMGLSVARPHLRAQLEADLRDICDGRKDPKLVLAEQVAKYKEVYITVTAEANKIDDALAERFNERALAYTPSVEAMPTMPPALKCPKCGSEMVVRQKKNNADEWYISCASYPRCSNAVWLPALVRSVQVLPDTCPAKKNNADEWYISCASYPRCSNAVWLPALVRSVQVLPDTCAACGPDYKKLKFEWRNNSISHIYPPPYTACIGGCDTTLLDLLRINLSSVKNVARNTSTNSTNPATNSNRDTTTTLSNSSSNSNPRSNSVPFVNTNNNTNTINRPRQFVPPAPVVRAQNSTNGPRMPAPRNATSHPRMPTPPSSGNGDNQVFCGCNREARLLTVRKEGPNQGKEFYKCQVGADNGGCDFFLWAPESTGAPGNVDTPPSSARGGSTSRGWGIAPSFPRDDYPPNDDDVMCNCGVPSKKLTVRKEGPNKGRQFYGCPKDGTSRCSFFQWADGETNTEWGSGQGYSGAGRGRGRGRGRGGGGGGGSAGDGEPRTRKCGLCRQEGHTRNRCPNNQ